MFKFLRKYNKWILAVGGTLLMIVFLIPQAIEGLAHSAGTARATRAMVVGADGSEQRITAGQWADVTSEFDLINRGGQRGSMIPAIGRLDGAPHWFLLTHEAEMAGLVGPPGSVQITQEMVNQLGVRVDVARRAMAKLDGVYRLLSLYQTAGEVSDHRLKEYARRILHQAEIEYFVVPASADASEYQPSNEELAAHLEEFGRVAPGEGEMGFGYRLPDRVKLEWLSVPAESVRQAIRDSDEMDNVSLRAHWMRQLRDPETTLPPIGDDPTIPQAVRDHMLEQLTNERLDAIARFANDQFRANRRGLSQRDGYFILPEDWSARKLSFEAVAEEIQSRFDVEAPEYRATGDRWLEFDELDELEGIGEATTDRFGTTLRDLYDLVTGAMEFGGSAIAQVQKGVTGPPLRTADGGVHLFRMVDVDASRAPHSVDEVRDQLVRDLRRRDHYQQLKGQLSGIEQTAQHDGMLSAAMDFDTYLQNVSVTLADFAELSRMMQTGEAIVPVSRAIPGIGVNREATEAIIERAMQLPAGAELQELSDDQRIFVLPVDDNLALLGVRIVRNEPLTRELYSVTTNTVKMMLLNEELGTERLRKEFSLDKLIERNQFRLYTPAGEEDVELIELDDLPGQVLPAE